MSTKTPTTDIIAVLDESGSMAIMGNEPVESLDKFISSQKQLDPSSLFSLFLFSSDVKISCKNKPVSAYTGTEYNPGGMTALWDAVGVAITDKLNDNDRNRNVVMIVITDGQDNSSREFDRTKVKKLIHTVENKYNWNVQMIGANIDTCNEGTSVGMKRAKCMSFNQQKSGDLSEAMNTVSQACSYYRTCAIRGQKSEDVNLEKLRRNRSAP